MAKRRWVLASAFITSVALVSAAVTAPSWAGEGIRLGIKPQGHGSWIDTWVAMPQLTEPGNLPPAPFTQDGVVMADTTLRQTIYTSTGGRQLRVRFSNAFGGSALTITSAAVAMPSGGQAGVSAIEPGTQQRLTFGGRASTTIPVGAQAVSDPVNLKVAAASNLTVTLYLANGQATQLVTSHPGSRTSSYLLAGDHVADSDLPGAASVAHWYFLSEVEVWSPRGASAVTIVGDSLTDGRGSTTNGNDRWPNLLAARLRSDRSTDHLAVLNEAAGGNRVLDDGLGPNLMSRLDRDVFAHNGVERLIIFEGVNDLGTAAATEAAQQSVTERLIAAFDQAITQAHTHGISVYGATLPPFGGNTGYDDAAGLREGSRQALNLWIRTSGRFDAVLDFDAATRDPAAPRQLRADYDVGDHLHLNPVGYQALADAVPLRLFRDHALPWWFSFS